MDLAPFSGIPGLTHASGCPRDCRHAHLTSVTASRLADAGVNVSLIRAALDDEALGHGSRVDASGLTAAGRLHLVSWGASPDEIEQIGGSSGGTVQEAGYHDKARERARKSRDNAGDEGRRARDRANSAAYRERKARERGAGGGNSQSR